MIKGGRDSIVNATAFRALSLQLAGQNELFADAICYQNILQDIICSYSDML
jgi:hypothetical protein